VFLRRHDLLLGASCRRRLCPVSSAPALVRIIFGWFRRAPIAPTEEQLRVTQALVDYPPHEWTPDPEFLRDANVAYREYFFASRQVRLDALRDFFAKLDVALNLEDVGIMAVSTWLPQYADLLVDYSPGCISGVRSSSRRVPLIRRLTLSLL
jgi:hypothetical protein